MKLEVAYETKSQDFKKTLAELDKGILSLASMLNKKGYNKPYSCDDEYRIQVGIQYRIQYRQLIYQNIYTEFFYI